MNEIKVSIAIQHAPHSVRRRRWLKSIVNRLRAEKPEIAVEVIEDKTHAGSWPTYLRCLQAASGASHHLVLQDDITFCQDFLGAVEEVIQARPRNMIALFTNSPAVFTARRRGETWIQDSMAAGPAVIWPRHFITEFIDWQEAHIATAFPWDDLRVSMWLHKTSKPIFATAPSLTQHLGFNLSLLGLSSRSKVAAWYVGDQRSGLGIDWTKGLESPARDRTQIQWESWRYYRSKLSAYTHEGL